MPLALETIGLPRLALLLFWVCCLNTVFDHLNQAEAQQSVVPCSLCQDGSEPTNPDGRVILDDGEDWKCSDLMQILDLLGVTAGGEQCASLQFQGFLNCGCPTFADENYCSLCPGGFSDIPFPTISIPGYNGLTCFDILFARRDDEAAALSCDELGRFSRLCRCPDPDRCSLCRYSGEVPSYPDRRIPYLSSQDDNHVTCAEQQAAAILLPLNERCEEHRQAPVPVDVQGYCGCPMTSPVNACTLCPEGGNVQNPDLVVPNVGGLNCLELEEYLPYITDVDSCNTIAASAEACCTSLDPCPVCPDGSNGLGSEKVYEPYSLDCDLIGQASHYGFPLTCADAQQRFSYFCRCPNVNPRCTVCPFNLVPPDPNRFIPLLNLTCGEVNDFVSLRTAQECQATLATFSVDVAAFCGCSRETSSLLGRCAFCPQGQSLISAESGNNEVQGFPESLFGAPDSRITPAPAETESRCQALEDFSFYVTQAGLCTAVQQSVPECCRPVSTDAPTFSTIEAPTQQPTFEGTPPSTLDNVNGTVLDDMTNNSSDIGNATFVNTTLAPTTFPPAVPDAQGSGGEESSAMSVRPKSQIWFWGVILVGCPVLI